MPRGIRRKMDVEPTALLTSENFAQSGLAFRGGQEDPGRKAWFPLSADSESCSRLRRKILSWPLEKASLLPWSSFPPFLGARKEKEITLKVHSCLSAVCSQEFIPYQRFLNLCEYFKGLKADSGCLKDRESPNKILVSQLPSTIGCSGIHKFSNNVGLLYYLSLLPIKSDIKQVLLSEAKLSFIRYPYMNIADFQSDWIRSRGHGLRNLLFWELISVLFVVSYMIGCG